MKSDLTYYHNPLFPAKCPIFFLEKTPTRFLIPSVNKKELP